MEDEDKPLTADELIESADRKAASDAIKKLAERHVSQLLDVQEQFPLENVDLLSSKIASNQGIPAEIRQKITDFQKKMRSVIEEVATRIEERNYRSAQEAISAMRMGKTQKEQVSALMLADKKVHISCQSLRVTVDVFSEANRMIIASLEEGEAKGDPQLGRALLLGNAVLVYELTDFVIAFIEKFRLAGIEDIKEIYDNIKKKIGAVRQEQEALRKGLESEEIEPATKDQIIANVEARERSLEALMNEWQEYMAALNDIDGQVNIVAQKMPTLKLIRDNAKVQLDLLEVWAVMQVVKSNLGAIQAAALTIESMSLVSLTPDKLRRLFVV